MGYKKPLPCKKHWQRFLLTGSNNSHRVLDISGHRLFYNTGHMHMALLHGDQHLLRRAFRNCRRHCRVISPHREFGHHHPDWAATTSACFTLQITAFSPVAPTFAPALSIADVARGIGCRRQQSARLAIRNECALRGFSLCRLPVRRLRQSAYRFSLPAVIYDRAFWSGTSVRRSD